MLCTNALTAAQVLQTLTRLGSRIPQDLRRGSSDDVRLATLLGVPLN